MNLKIRPSGLDRAMRCPGSVKACLDIPREQTEAMKRGIKLHELTAMVLWADSGAAWDQAVKEAGPDVEDLRAVVGQARELAPLAPHETLIEKKLWLKTNLGIEDGTPDLVYVLKQDKAAVLIEHKFGHGPVEDPADNWQMKAYATGLSLMQIDTVECYILQPATWGKRIKLGIFGPQDFNRFIPEIKAGIKAVQKDDAPRTPGSQQCKWCPANKTCPEFLKWNGAIQAEKQDTRVRNRDAAVQGGTAITVTLPAELARPIVVISEQAIQRAQDLEQEARTIEIVDQETANRASALLKEISRFKKDIEESRLEVFRPFREFIEQGKSEAEKATLPLTEGYVIAQRKMTAFIAEQEERIRKQQAEQLKKQQAAQEAQRKAQEAQQKAEREAQAAKTAAQRAKAEEARVKAEEEARKAQALAETPAPPAPAPVAVSGVKTNKTVTFNVLDFAKLPDAYKMVNEAAIKADVKAKKLTEKGIPGVLEIGYEAKIGTTGR